MPPGGLIVGQLSHGLSWLLLFLLAGRGELGFSLGGLAWVHLVALGWVTLVALSMLFYFVPKLIGVAWRWEGAARGALGVFAVGALAFAAGLWFGLTAVAGWAAMLAAAALGLYLAAAFRTLLSVPRGSPRAAGAARMLVVALAFLAAAAALGAAMARGLAGGHAPGRWGDWAAAHAQLAGLGWFTALIIEISLRTLRPIAGAVPPPRHAGIAAGGVAVGTLAVAAGLAAGSRWPVWLGAVCAAAALALYLADLFDTLGRAGNPFRPPQAFMAAAGAWLALDIALGAAILRGHPVAPAYVYLGLMGWVGQMVNAHLAVFGPRLLATLVLGVEDETPSAQLLSQPLLWASFALAQLAVGAGALGLLIGRAPLVGAAAACGGAAWLLMLAGVAGAWRTVAARRAAAQRASR